MAQWTIITQIWPLVSEARKSHYVVTQWLRANGLSGLKSQIWNSQTHDGVISRITAMCDHSFSAGVITMPGQARTSKKLRGVSQGENKFQVGECQVGEFPWRSHSKHWWVDNWGNTCSSIIRYWWSSNITGDISLGLDCTSVFVSRVIGQCMCLSWEEYHIGKK